MKVRKGVRAIIMTLTNNIKGGQPVSIANIKAVSQIAKKYGILLIFDASRFADNAFLNKEYDHLRGSVRHISRHIFNFCDIVYLSSKKDGLVNIGGFIGMRDQTLYKVLQTKIIQQESYPSSGGLAARDIAAMNLGLSEATNEDFLKSHIGHLRYLARLLKKNSVAVFEPVGGHGIVIFTRQNFKYAAYSLGAVLFVEAGIRGGVFNDEFRLALPRRVYTKSHLEYVANALCRIYLMILPRLTLVNKPQHFFNFFARFKPVSW